jgi:hypothetical protein
MKIKKNLQNFCKSLKKGVYYFSEVVLRIKEEKIMSDRPTISQVVVTFDDGTTATYLPSEVCALFLDWDVVEKILIPFYESGNYEMTKLQAENEFGPIAADDIFGTAPGPKKIEKTFIDKVWKNKGKKGTLPSLLGKRPEKGTLPSLLGKRPECIITEG